jgi:hypothetical protein
MWCLKFGERNSSAMGWVCMWHISAYGPKNISFHMITETKPLQTSHSCGALSPVVGRAEDKEKLGSKERRNLNNPD